MANHPPPSNTLTPQADSTIGSLVIEEAPSSFIVRFDHFVVVSIAVALPAVATTAATDATAATAPSGDANRHSTALGPPSFQAWLAGSCVAPLCSAITTVFPEVVVEQYPHALVSGRSTAHTTVRVLVGIRPPPVAVSADPQAAATADFTTRLTCGLQAFVRQLRLLLGPGRGRPGYSASLAASSPSPPPPCVVNARYAARADLGALPDPSPANHSSNSALDSLFAAVTAGGQLLPASGVAAIISALRLAPDMGPPPPHVPHSALQPTSPPSTAFLSGGDGSSSAGTPKLRPVSDVLDRLKWDASLGGVAGYVVGYRDRFDGVLELPLSYWVAESTSEDWIPLHRISYVRRADDAEAAASSVGSAASRGRYVWWREGRVDLIFGSGVTGAAANATGSITARS
ncbi:hypothetical protein HK405_011040 [Cladochytrium tenue]|nr:hypothetical protein HK405_011040 [Cladochytrium tenue]